MKKGVYTSLALLIKGRLGAPVEAISRLDSEDDDWTFVIKTHALIESILNQLIVGALKEKRINDIVSFMDTGDRRTGKLAFIKALDLLPPEARQFISILSKLRNDLVHDTKLLSFTFSEWIKGSAKSSKDSFRDSIAFAVADTFRWKNENLSRVEFATRYPRDAIMVCTIILFQKLERQLKSSREPTRPNPKES